MKTKIKILAVIINLAAVAAISLYLFLVFQGKNVIIKQIEGLTKKKVTIERCNIRPFFKLELSNLQIQDTAKIDSAFVHLNLSTLLGFITGNLIYDEVWLKKPEFKLEIASPLQAESCLLGASSDNAADIPKVSSPGAKKVNGKINQIKPPPLLLILKHVNISDGKIDFIDHRAGKNGIRIILKDLSLDLTNQNLLTPPIITNFELAANIPWVEGEEEGKLKINGWVNLVKKDLRANLEIEGIDGIYLYPYYSNWIELEKTGVKKAKLNFISNITGINNMLTAECHIELTDIVCQKHAPEESREKSERITNTVLDAFKQMDKGKIVLDFTIRTKMDKPIFNLGDIKMAFEEKLGAAFRNNQITSTDVLMFPARLLEGTVKATTDASKAMVLGTFSISNELWRTFEASFKRQAKNIE
ncbi:MAG: DUF748 domain-containing protein [Candidatus Omnitrophota bacterium]